MTLEPSVSADDIIAILTKSGLTPQETAIVPGRQAQHLPVPKTLHQLLFTELDKLYPSGLYSHQTEAIHAILGGSDVCLATPTASGKSLVFMSAAADRLLRDRFAKVLAIYPAKALIQDQLAKWRQFLEPLGIRSGFIDGSVAVANRPAILKSCGVVAITPDVTHAWLMSRLADKEVSEFLGHLSLLILDEAHVYDGAFGTNMAYLLRRIAVASTPYRLVCSTATVGAPEEFIRQLVGRQVRVLDADSDGSAIAEKTLLLSPIPAKGGFDRMVQLLAALANYGRARFLAFGDSRKAVELLVAATLRQRTSAVAESEGEEDTFEPTDDDLKKWPQLEHVLPYRAGYEASDREAIQKALTEGSLAGVVSTSALELGLDIGDLDIVVLLSTPPSMKAFFQRIGRAGRRRPAVCILIDDQGVMSPLDRYVLRKPEPSWLYLENRYIQYAHALCAAVELQARGVKSAAAVDFEGLPESFKRFVENEINPKEGVPQDLYSLKQRAQGNPHYEFPIRSAAEPNFDVEGPLGLKLGQLSYAQALREAYPGAVYYYMAQPFRVLALEFKKGKILAGRAKHFTTKPLTDTMAFPDFKNGIISAWKSSAGFVVEAELQVSERVKGFAEQRGPTRMSHDYGPTSSYSQTPLTRFFRTTGVCWAFPNEVGKSEALSHRMFEAFSFSCGIQERDLGVAFFHANEGPFSPTPVQGTAIFDATNGSLRLTERLASQFESVVAAAIEQCEDDKPIREELLNLQKFVRGLERHTSATQSEPAVSGGDWVRLIAPNEPAMYMHPDGSLEVTVLNYRYTPNGIMYELRSIKEPGHDLHTQYGKHGRVTEVLKNAPAKWMVLASHLQPIHGRTKMVRVNLVTGDQEQSDEAAGE